MGLLKTHIMFCPQRGAQKVISSWIKRVCNFCTQKFFLLIRRSRNISLSKCVFVIMASLSVKSKSRCRYVTDVTKLVQEKTNSVYSDNNFD